MQSIDLVDKDYVTKKCSVRLQPLGLDVKQILSMEESEKSHLKDGNKEQQKRDNDSFNDGLGGPKALTLKGSVSKQA